MLERLDEADTEAANLQRALEHSRDIGAAVGVLMAFHKVPQDEAFELLRRTSQDLNRKLDALAGEVLATGEAPAICAKAIAVLALQRQSRRTCSPDLSPSHPYRPHEPRPSHGWSLARQPPASDAEGHPPLTPHSAGNP